MKKLMFSITLLLLAAFAITACSAATPAVPTATVGAAPTTAATAAVSPTGAATTSATTAVTAAATGAATGAATTAGTTSATTAATSAATTAATSAATTAATSAATAQATVAATGTGTPSSASAATTPQATQGASAGAAVTGTPSASVQGQFVRLSILLQSSLVTNAETGKITGVVISQPGVTASGAATPTPAAGQVSVPYVKYVLVNMNSSSSAAAKETLLPFQMFQFNTTTASNGTFSQTFTLKGPASSRANVPQVSLPTQTGVLQSGWDNQLSPYWASQGFTIPVTGGSQAETDVLLRSTLAGTNISDNNNKVLGQVADFLIDPTNGQFAYAVFNGGSLFGNKNFIVPMRDLVFQLNSASASGLGNIHLNFDPNMLNNAPSIDLNQLMQNPALIQQIITFFQSIQTTK